MASSSIGAKLRQQRVSLGLTIEEIALETRIAPRFLEAIETDDSAQLPGLVFTRNFVRQYALALKLDPEPLVAALPKLDESMVPLPNRPARPRSSQYGSKRGARSIVSTAAWLVLAGAAAFAAYTHLEHSPRTRAAAPGAIPGVKASGEAERPAARTSATVEPAASAPAASSSAASPASSPAPFPSSAPVNVTLTAKDAAWVQVSADGKIAFTGTLKSAETKEISAAEQVKILTGNAGGLTISLNGKTIESLGPPGQVRAIKLTAEGPEFPSKAPQPAPDPL